MKVVFRKGDAIILFTVGKTSNKKIANPDETIVQHYSFSKDQYEVSKRKTSMAEFFSYDKSVCMDCPFAVSNGAKLLACYTHKPMQYMGFLSSLRSIAKRYPRFSDIPQLTVQMEALIVGQSAGRYVRFGSYGEPTLIPVGLVRRICDVASSWTGYTHQFTNKAEYAPYFMASTHGVKDTFMAKVLGFRSFCATKDTMHDMVHCPASKESGFKSRCSKCSLCSGALGKSCKSVNILIH